MRDGGKAFPEFVEGIPSYERRATEEYRLTGGMTLRQWYKGMAVAGLLTTPDCSVTDAVRLASEAADALLAEDAEKARHE